MKTRLKAITPIVATILLVVVAVILVTIILSWGKGFTNTSLDKTKTIKTLSVSDAGAFVYPKGISNGILEINYQPPAAIQEEITITGYQILEIPEMEPVTLSTPITLTNNRTNILDLECMYEYSVTDPKMTIQLITEDNTFITVNQRDTRMVCTSGGTGTLADPIIVCNAEDLNNIRTALDANYSLGKDIDLQCFSRQEENGWEPIGYLPNTFKGIFEGNNHTISNLFINRSATDYIGLFIGTYAGSEIRNIGLEDVNIIGHDNTGGLVGYNGGTISSSYSTGTVFGTSYTGGLVGYNGGTITSSYFTGTVSGTSFVGGLFGFNNRGTIASSYSTGTVSGTGSVGGLVGQNYRGTITSSYSTGTVSGTGPVGGLVGSNGSVSAATISNSYSLGNVVRLSGVSTEFGGFVGWNYQNSITNCYSIGSVSGTGWTPTTKGFAGLVTTGGSYADINNFYDTTTSLQTSTAGNALGKTTSEMKTQSTFTGWDFTTIWNISEGNTYPYLTNNPQSPLPQ